MKILFKFLLIVFLSLGIFSCKPLQKTKEYEHYPKNEYWKVDIYKESKT